jgi:subtilisin family serine protease
MKKIIRAKIFFLSFNILLILAGLVLTLYWNMSGFDKPSAENYRKEYLDSMLDIKELELEDFKTVYRDPVYGKIEKRDGELVYVMPNLSTLITTPNAEVPRSDIFIVDTKHTKKGFTRTTFQVYFSSDPLSIHQWYIKNYGLNAFDVQGFNRKGEIQYPRTDWTFLGKSGVDLNVPEAWKLGATGKGISVIVYDNGVDPNNPDLKNKINLEKAVNFITGVYSTDNRDYHLYSHGTKVAGIIAAEAFNRQGVRGIAYDSTIIPWRYSNVWEDYQLFEFPPEAKVFQNSVGNDPGKLINTEPFAPSLLYADLVYFLSKGNYYIIDYYEIDPKTGRRNLLFNGCTYYQINCAETPKLSTQPIYYPVLAAVSGISSNGEHIDYGTPPKYHIGINASTGSDVMFVAFNTTAQSAMERNSKGIFTTGVPMDNDNSAIEQLTPFKDSPSYKSYYNFYNARDPDNPDIAYTGHFNGTSAAAPMISGVAALVRSINSKLTWTDTYDILIRSSSIGRLAHRPGVRDEMNLWFADGSNLLIERPAEMNGAGFIHSNVYGFGLVNAGKAIKLARSYRPSDLEKDIEIFLATVKIHFSNLSFRAADRVSDATSEVSASTDAEGKVFAAVLELPPSFLKKFETEEDACGKSLKIVAQDQIYYRGIYYNDECRISDLTFTQLEIESPSGRISVIKPMGSMYLMMKNLDLPHRIETKAFYGENIKGTWKVRAITSKGERWKVKYTSEDQVITRNRSADRSDLVTDVTLEIYPLATGEIR